MWALLVQSGAYGEYKFLATLISANSNYLFPIGLPQLTTFSIADYPVSFLSTLNILRLPLLPQHRSLEKTLWIHAGLSELQTLNLNFAL